MKKLMALLLALVLTLALAGCGPTDAELLVGSWNGEMDMTQSMNRMLAEDEYLAEYGVTLDSFKLSVTMTFREDGTYEMTVDPASVDAALDGFMESMEAAVVAMLEEQIAASGLDMTVEEMLQVTGMSMDDVMAEIMGSIDAQDAAQEMSSQGQYKALDGKLYTSDDVDEEPGLVEYDVYTLEDATLTLSEHVGDDSEDSELTGMVYPIVLTKAE